MNGNKIKVVMLFVALFLLSSTVLASENFQISTVDKFSALECSSSEAGSVYITNTGDVNSQFLISVLGDLAKYASIIPSSFELGPGFSKQVSIYFGIPCGKKGSENVEIFATTNLGLKKSIKQKVKIEKPKNILITPLNFSSEILPCSVAPYQFKIKNTGTFTETYTLKFEAEFGKFVSVNFNQVTLTPNQETDLLIYIKPSCEIYGNFSVPFIVKTTNTKLSAQTSLTLNVKRAYDYSLTLGDISNSVEIENATDQFILHDKGEIYSLCANSVETILLKIKNNAHISNSYEVLLNPIADWIKISKNNVNLEAGSESVLEIQLDTSRNLGDFSFFVNSVSDLGKIEKYEELKFSVNDCYTAKVLNNDGKKKYVIDYEENSLALNIENIGEQSANYILSLESENWLSFDKTSISVNSGEVGTVNIISNPPSYTKRGTYEALIKINVEGTNVFYADSVKITLVKMNMFDRAYYNYIVAFFWYILSAVVLIIFLVFGFRVLISRVKARQKERAEKAKLSGDVKKLRSKISKKKIISLAILFIALFGVIIAAYYLYSEYVDSYLFAGSETTLLQFLKYFIIDYSLYFGVGLILIIILIVLLLFLKKRKKKKAASLVKQGDDVSKSAEKEVQKRVKSRRNKTKIWILSILALIVLYLVVAVLSGFYPFTSVSGLPIDTDATVSDDKIGITQTIINYLPLNYLKDILINNLFYVLYGIIGLIVIIALLVLNSIRKKQYKTIFKQKESSRKITLTNKKLSCGELIISLTRPIYNAFVLLRLSKRPTFIKAADLIYEYFEIKTENISSSDIHKIIIRFRVKKSWLFINSVRKHDVSLKKYDDKWSGVNTALISEDNKYYYYESILNEFSYFAITGKKTEHVVKIKEDKALKKEIFKQPEKRIAVKSSLKIILLYFISVILGLLIIGTFYYYWQNIFDFIITYKWYLLSGIGLLILFALGSLYATYFKERKEKVKRKSPKRKKESNNAKIIISAVIIAIIALAGVWSYFTYYDTDFSFASLLTPSEVFVNESGDVIATVSFEDLEESVETEDEISDVVEIISELEDDSEDIFEAIIEPVKEVESEDIVESDDEAEEIIETVSEPEEEIEPEYTGGIPNVEWNEDSQYTINLSKYFIDLDEDLLNFSHTDLQNIKVVYQDGIATLIPNKDWHGSEFVIFSADDMQGGEVESNLVKLTVLDVVEPSIFKQIVNYVIK